VSLILSAFMSLKDLERLTWFDVDFQAASVVIRHREEVRTAPMTELLVRQLLAVKEVSERSRVFAACGAMTTSIGEALRNLFSSAGLPELSPADFRQWSLEQTPAIRLAVITAASY